MAIELKIEIPPLPRWLIAPVFSGDRLMYVDMQDWWISRFCMVDRFEPEETALVQSLLRPGDTFLDIGANLGWYTLAASLILGKGGAIHAFEPRHDTGERLAMTISLNGLADLVTLHRNGVWSEDGHLDLFVGDQTAPGCSHVVDDAAGGETISMAVGTIDSLGLSSCHCIKIDIEGAEPHAIRGARDTIARHRPFILSELHGKQLETVSNASMDDYICLLGSLEYDAYYAAGDERGTPARADDERLRDLPFASILFVPREKDHVDWRASFRSA